VQLSLTDGCLTLPLAGSFPYHGNSSVCLAAIHSGLIRNEDGGGVFLTRFWPETWANDSTQTIFPHGSNASSVSNGVQTQHVPPSWYTVPSPLKSYSWTLQPRGVVASQRQTAPFSPRAGHAAVNIQRIAAWNPGRSIPCYYHDHLIIGGMNDTHYMNDVTTEPHAAVLH
jgi:hypothetical protein